MKRKTTSDVYDIDKKTGALIIGKNRLDDYATKFLNKYCKEALVRPMPIPVNDIIKKMGLTVVEESLSDNLDVYGCCLLLDSDVAIYDKDNNKYVNKSYPKGTILIDPLSEQMYGSGSMKNTLIHEAIHWEKDKRFFEILELKNKKSMEDLYPIMCKRSNILYEPPEKVKTKQNQIYWLEWQAVKLAPRVLMPKKMFIKKALEVAKKNKNNNDFKGQHLIDELSTFFQVSKMSARYRVLELNIKNELSSYIDVDYFDDEESKVREYIKLTPYEAYQMVEKNPSLDLWIKSGKYIFVDGYFVKPKSQYIKLKNGSFELTNKAKKDFSKCVINIIEYKYLDYESKYKNHGYAYLTKIEGIDKKIFVFHPSCQVNLPDNIDSEEVYKEFCDVVFDDSIDKEETKLAKMLGDPSISLCNCLWYLMKNRHMTRPAAFEQATNLHVNYYGKIKNDKYNNMDTNTLIAICIGLKLNFRTIQEIFEKSENAKFNSFKEPHKTYRKIIEFVPGLSINSFNNILEERGLEPLGSKIRE